MGNTNSTAQALSSIVNQTVTNVMTNNTANCSQANTAIQNLQISNIKAKNGCSININGLTQTATQAPNFACTNTQNSSAQLATALNNALTQAANSSANGGIGNTNANANTISNITNQITNNISMSDVSNCVQSTYANQNMLLDALSGSCPSACGYSASDIAALGPTLGQDALNIQNSSACAINLGNIGQTLTQTVVGNCLNNQSNLTSAINSVAAQVSQSTSAASTGGSLLPDMSSLASFGSTGVLMYIVIIFVVLSIIGVSSSSIIPLMGNVI